jgi:putative ABC transport system permease protein
VKRSHGLTSLIRRAVRARRMRATLTVVGVATSTLLVMVLLAAFRNPVVSVVEYVAQPGLDVWVMPSGTDNFLRTAGFLPLSVVNGIRELDGVAQADALLRVFVRVKVPKPRPGAIPSLMMLALGYRVPDGLGGPPAFAAGSAPHGAGEIALDRAAAFRLRAVPGDTVLVNDRACRVVGLSRKTNVLATQFLFFDFEVAEHTSGLAEQASFVVVRAKPGAAAEVMRRIRDEFPGVSVLSGREFLDNSLRETSAGFLPVLMLIATLGVLASAVLVALLVQGLVEDRRADIAVLGALGVSSARIGTAVIVHACLLVGGGTLLGAIAARGLEALLDQIVPTIQLAFDPRDVLMTLGAFALAGVVGALAPVMRLRRIDPLEAFRT